MKNKLCVALGALTPVIGFGIVSCIDNGEPNIFSVGVLISTLIITVLLVIGGCAGGIFKE
ncbi:MAG: hypothetical protein EKK64_00730 [Neisseriaceae bacterium]|nr:MAG: hypothetical protein EKK64_00730 [Neisseriaceae bacterium]